MRGNLRKDLPMCRHQPYHNRCILLPLAALVTGFVALAAPSRGQVINEDLKLLAIQGQTHDNFGFSIAIDNGVVAVGAWLGDDLGSDSGAAYLFNASTGAQIAQLLPMDGSGNEWFGYSIAIDNGVVAVGCRLDDIGFGGMDNGSAYLFNASTGAQIAKLLPEDGASLDYFGYSIAIGNGIVAVGAYYDDDNGTDSGSVYLFNASGGPQIFKLLPEDGAAGDHFGQSIAIDNGVVAVGADDDDGIFTDSGSAYLFNASTGAQIHKLLPDDGHRSRRRSRSGCRGQVHGRRRCQAHRRPCRGHGRRRGCCADARPDQARHGVQHVVVTEFRHRRRRVSILSCLARIQCGVAPFGNHFKQPLCFGTRLIDRQPPILAN